MAVRTPAAAALAVACLCVSFCLPGNAAESQPHSASLAPASRLASFLKSNPGPATDLQQLAAAADELAGVAKRRAEVLKKERMLRPEDLAACSISELQEHFHTLPGKIAKREVRGLKAISHFARSALAASRVEDRALEIARIQEVFEALRNNQRSPIPPSTGLLLPWKLFFRDWHRSIGEGTTPATNLSPTGADLDLSRIDPVNSTFWKRPVSIAGQDLGVGFGRSRLPELSTALGTYHGPKTSAGTKAGIEVKIDGVVYQVKFSEIHSEPFTARIFDALGFFVDPTDYAPQLKIRYDRRLFREFNLRQPLQMKIRPLWIPLGSLNFQPHYDPFDFVSAAVLKDGRQINGIDLKRMLFRNPNRRDPERDPQNFRPEMERAINYIITVPANVQPKDHPAKSVGPWGFSGLGHEDRRELRAAGLLAAWLGWFDARFDNTRLRVAETGGTLELQHFFTDLGAGMGSGTGRFFRYGEDPRRFTWTFTSAEVVADGGRITRPFRVRNYQTIVPCPAFQNMTADDARWMARMIGQLTEKQLHNALLASGFDADVARLFLEKLLSRREQMIRDLGLNR